MATDHIQRIYEDHVSLLSAGERLSLVEMITRGLAVPDAAEAVAAVADAQVLPAATELRAMPGWHPAERRADFSKWQDRAL